MNDRAVESSGRFQVDDDDLIIHYVTRKDKDIVVSCKAVEERGLTTLTNTTVPVGCKLCLCVFEICKLSEWCRLSNLSRLMTKPTK